MPRAERALAPAVKVDPMWPALLVELGANPKLIDGPAPMGSVWLEAGAGTPIRAIVGQFRQAWAFQGYGRYRHDSSEVATARDAMKGALAWMRSEVLWHIERGRAALLDLGGGPEQLPILPGESP